MDSQQQPLTLKIFFQNEIRRMSVFPPFPDWESFLRQVSSLFGIEIPREHVRLYYDDDENDRIIVNSELEWQGTLTFLSGRPLYKLYIENNTNKSNSINNTNNINQAPDTDMNEGQEPSFPSSFPFNRPPFARGFFRPHHPYGRRHWNQHMRPGCERFNRSFDVNNNANRVSVGPHGIEVQYCNSPCTKKEFRREFKIHKKWLKKKGKLERKMHKRAYRELEKNNYEVASKLLEAVICLDPTEPVAFYNLACCDALSGKTESALTNLCLAIENGYSNLQHIQNDKDLENLRNLPEYQEIIERLAGKGENIAATLGQLNLNK